MRISDWSSDVCSSDLLAAAERAGIVHLLGHEFRWGPDRALLAQAIREGRIGTPRFVSVLSYLPLLADPAAPMPDWWFDTDRGGGWLSAHRSEEHTSELQSQMRIPYAVFCLNKKKKI